MTLRMLLSIQRPLWQKVAAGLSSAWTFLVLALVLNAVLRAPSFEVAASEPCPQFLLPIAGPVERFLWRMDARLVVPFVQWKDAVSRERITTFRRHEQALSCTTMEYRARTFLAAAQAGLLTPRVSIHRGALALLVLVPSGLFVLLSYLVFRSRPARGGASG